MKTLVLYTRPGSYTVACLEALQEKIGRENLLLIRYPMDSNAPFYDEMFESIANKEVQPNASLDELLLLVDNFKPDVLLMSGWVDKRYLKIAKILKKQGVLTIAVSDTQWRGTLRQWAARFIAKYFLHEKIDILWVAGERQATLARHLGFYGRSLWDGALCCDWKNFAPKGLFEGSRKQRQHAYLYSGRLIEVKGVETLLRAYQAYRNACADPWELWIAGTGHLAAKLDSMEGVRALGFLQAHELASKMQEAGAFVLASHSDAWGLVVQEAAAAGLPILSSDRVGASVHMVRDGLNGYIHAGGDVGALKRDLIRIASLDQKTREEMGRVSFELSRQYLPELWAERLIRGFQEVRIKKL